MSTTIKLTILVITALLFTGCTPAQTYAPIPYNPSATLKKNVTYKCSGSINPHDVTIKDNSLDIEFMGLTNTYNKVSTNKYVRTAGFNDQYITIRGNALIRNLGRDTLYCSETASYINL